MMRVATARKFTFYVLEMKGMEREACKLDLTTMTSLTFNMSKGMKQARDLLSARQSSRLMVCTRRCVDTKSFKTMSSKDAFSGSQFRGSVHRHLLCTRDALGDDHLAVAAPVP